MSESIANEIYKQIGSQAFYMMGAKRKTTLGGDNFLAFKIGRNSTGINYVKVELTSMDVYKVTFSRIHGNKHTIKKVRDGVYDDMLCGVIEEEIQMRLSLTRIYAQ